jgi:UDP-glucose:(heptosyl)LPS alpha-1,3-glucosyltransferase
MNVPRIAVVVPKYGLVGGGERFASEVTERLARTGRYEMHVFANRWQATQGSPVIFHRVPMLRFPRSLRPWSFAWFAQRMIAGGGFDLVHSHDRLFRADVFSLHCVPHAGWVRDVRQKTPSVFDRGVIGVERRMMCNSRAARFLPVSSLAMEAFRREYGELPGRWEVMSPGVDVARFASPGRAACRREIRGRHGIGESDFLLLFVGMNFEVKGLDKIIASLPKTQAKLLVVGRGDERKYRDLARSLGVGDAVQFAGTKPEQIERYYRAADAFIMLSVFDTFGLVVLEAMAAGLPVIVSENVGAKDLVENGKNGFVVLDEVAMRVVELQDADRRGAMGLVSQQCASTHSWDAVVQKMETVYLDVLKSERRGYCC